MERVEQQLGNYRLTLGCKILAYLIILRVVNMKAL